MPQSIFRLLICLCVLSALSVHTRAQDALERLDSPDYAVREAATQALLADDSLTPEAVAAMYDEARSLEVRTRLLDVARHHTLRRLAAQRFNPQAPGAVGFSQQMAGPGAMANMAQLGHPAIRVVATLPGLPAYAHLQPGDMIVGVDNDLLPPDASMEGLTTLITTRTAGQPITLNLLRDGREVAAQFSLGSLAALNTVYTTDRIDLTPRVRPEFQQAWTRLRDDQFDGGLRPLVLRAQ